MNEIVIIDEDLGVDAIFRYTLSPVVLYNPLCDTGTLYVYL